MSNVILKSDLSATAHLRKNPLGLHKAVNLRKTSSFSNNNPSSNSGGGNPILKKVNPHLQNNNNNDYDDLDPIDQKLREFQMEVQQTENVQKSKLEQDDEIVERRLQQVHEREEKIKASIAGEKIAVEDPLQNLPHHQILQQKKEQQQHPLNNTNNNDNDDDHETDEEKKRLSLLPKKVEDNLYTEAYYTRENQRLAKKQEKLDQEKEVKEKAQKEKKRKGTLANLAIKMKLNPEKYEGIDDVVATQKKQEKIGENDHDAVVVEKKKEDVKKNVARIPTPPISGKAKVKEAELPTTLGDAVHFAENSPSRKKRVE